MRLYYKLVVINKKENNNNEYTMPEEWIYTTLDSKIECRKADEKNEYWWLIIVNIYETEQINTMKYQNIFNEITKKQ